MHLGNSLLNNINNASIVVKSSITAVIVFYLVGVIPGAYSIFSITPGLLLPPNFRVWTLVTGLVIEASICNVLIDIPLFIVCGLHLEPLWGALELLKFIAVTGIGTTLLTSFVSLAAYAFTQNYSLWFVQFSGIAGILGGVTVAFKQIIPDYKIDLKVQLFRVQDAPIFSLLVYIFLSVIRVFSYTQPIMLTCGIIVGWIYLRFYQQHGKGTRGDMSENFEAAMLCPNFAKPAVRLIAAVLFKLLVKVGFCKKPVRTYDVGAPSSITISLPGTDPADAERRRKKALRALNERLVQLQHKKTSPEVDDEDKWPTIEDQTKEDDTHSEEEINTGAINSIQDTVNIK